MRNRIKILLPCVLLTLAISSCYDEMDSKISIDGQYESQDIPTLTIENASATSFSSIKTSGSVSGNVEDFIEVGFMISTSNDFTTYTAYTADKVANFELVVGELKDNTTFYVRSYVVTKASGTVVSASKTVTTPVAPVFGITGVYTSVDYDVKTNEASNPYDVTITFAEGSTSNVEIANLWGGGKKVNGVYDQTKNAITVPTEQVISIHPDYGDVFMNATDGDVITFKFTPKGGFLVTDNWSAICSAGSFGDYFIKMTHK